MRGSIIILPVIRIERHDEGTLDQLVRTRQPIPANVVALPRRQQREATQPAAEPRSWK